MEFLGTIEEVWRYPVSSLGGERLTSVEISASGVAGDRTWCLVDSKSGRPAAPEMEARWRLALFLQSRLRRQLPEIGFPDGTWMAIDHRDLDARLLDHFDFDVTARPYSGTGTLAVNRYVPSPVHLITSSSLDHLRSLSGAAETDSRRFRPNVLIRTPGSDDFREAAWLGKRVKLGTCVLQASDEAERCGMTLIPQPGIEENPNILRSILRHNRRRLGIYASVEKPGAFSLGDSVYLASD